jgi:Zn-dependent peptidase ImmA (M78 family)
MVRTQIFTLAHELAHIWLGQSPLSDVEPISAPTHQVESWCNRIAAELLVPVVVFRREYRAARIGAVCSTRSQAHPEAERFEI